MVVVVSSNTCTDDNNGTDIDMIMVIMMWKSSG